MIPSISMVRTDPPTGYLEKIKANSRLEHCQLADPQIGRRIILVHVVQIGKTKKCYTSGSEVNIGSRLTDKGSNV